jgi:hypothetical protein
MSFKKMFSQQFPVPYVVFNQFFFLLFILVSCTDSGAGFKFPDPKSELWCTYNVSFDEGTNPQEMDKQKELMKRAVESNTRSTEDGIQCDPRANWVKIDDLHWQLELTVHCYRVSDTSTVRPPAGTKPPPARVEGGSVEKSGCGDDEIKK